MGLRLGLGVRVRVRVGVGVGVRVRRRLVLRSFECFVQSYLLLTTYCLLLTCALSSASSRSLTRPEAYLLRLGPG